MVRHRNGIEPGGIRVMPVHAQTTSRFGSDDRDTRIAGLHDRRPDSEAVDRHVRENHVNASQEGDF